MSAAHHLPDNVILGRCPHTHGPGVAQPDRDSPPPGGAVPILDTAPTPQSARMVATPSAIGPSHTSVTANHLEQHRVQSHPNATAMTVVSLLVAAGLASTALLIVDWAGSTFGAGNVVGFVATAAAGLCGVVLVVASLIGSTGGR